MNLRLALLHSFLWRKQFYVSYLILLTFCSVYYYFSPVKHPYLDASCLILSFFYCCTGLKSDSYSWKYFQALPLTKRELFHFFILNQFLVVLPILIWVLAFFPTVMDFLGAPYKGMNPGLFTIILLIYVTGSVFLGLVTFYGLFESIRAPYAKTSGLIAFVQKIRDILYYGIPVIILLFLIIGALALVASAISTYSNSLATIFMIALLGISFLGAYYWYVFRRWQREELSYTKINFKVLRDVPIMLGLMFLFVWGQTLFEDAPPFYGDSDLLEQLHQKDPDLYQKIYSGNLHSNSLHQKSGTGMTPLMVAAHMGDSRLFNALEKSGADRKGVVNYPKSRNLHGMNILMLAIEGRNPEIVKKLLVTESADSTNGKFGALSFATYKCSPEIVDLLLEKGAKINAVNEKGQTPLHIASRDNCLPVVVSLMENGADPLIKDKTGKLAKDYIARKYDRNRIAYYLEKKMRSPAGRK